MSSRPECKVPLWTPGERALSIRQPRVVRGTGTGRARSRTTEAVADLPRVPVQPESNVVNHCGQRLQRIVRRGSACSVHCQRATMLPASAGGDRVPVIAQLVPADEDTVRDVIHRFNEIGLACLDPQWAGGRPRLLSLDDEHVVVGTATTHPAKLGQPFTRWSLRKFAAYLRKVHGRVIRIGREALRCLLARRGVTFQRTKSWKESTDPEHDAELGRSESIPERLPDRAFAFDEFGPLGIRPTGGSSWAGKSRPSAGSRRPSTAPTG